MPDIEKYAISYSVNKTAYLRKFNRRIKKVAATNFSDLKNFRLILINPHIKFFIKKFQTEFMRVGLERLIQCH